MPHSVEGIPVIGVLGLLILAKEKGKIRRLRPLLEQLINTRYFLPNHLVDELLREEGG